MRRLIDRGTSGRTAAVSRAMAACSGQCRVRLDGLSCPPTARAPGRESSSAIRRTPRSVPTSPLRESQLRSTGARCIARGQAEEA